MQIGAKKQITAKIMKNAEFVISPTEPKVT